MEGPRIIAYLHTLTRRQRLLKLLLSGINSINPGPCILCNKQGKKNQQCLQCTKCKNTFHRTCLKMPSATYHHIRQDNSWTCSLCTMDKKPTCDICSQIGKAHCLNCTKCSRSYHKKCLRKNKIKTQNDDFSWICPP